MSVPILSSNPTFATTAIIMPAFDVSQYIGEAIESVLAQTREDWRLIIVDDGSTDDTVEIARSYDDPRITVVCQENAGAAAARNRAVAESQSEFLSMLDADDAWRPDYLEKMLGAFEAAPNYAFFACDAHTFVDEMRADNRCSENVSMVPPVTLERVASRDFQVYTAVTMRRDWFDAVGGFDNALRNAQDFDLWIRMLAAGGEAGFVNEPLAWYRDRADSLSSNDNRLSAFTIKVYEKLRVTRPDMDALCTRQIEKLRYTIALNKAKTALRAGRFGEFHERAEEALARGRNRKLHATLRLARVSRPLARLLMTARN